MGVRSLGAVEAKTIFEHLAQTGRPGLWLAISVVLRCWAVIPSVVGLVGIYPTFPERVDHRIRVARPSPAGATTAEWRRGLWILKLGRGGAQGQGGAGGARIVVGRVARIVVAGRVARIVIAGGVTWVISVVVGAVAAVAV